MHAINFNAGPAALPQDVLKAAAAELVDYHGCGLSVMEMSHRSTTFARLLAETKDDLRTLYKVPENYHILFMHGGGTGQFAAVPLNLMHRRRAGYIVSGAWSQKAQAEAGRYGEARTLASSADTGFDRTPDVSRLDLDFLAAAGPEAAADRSSDCPSPGVAAGSKSSCGCDYVYLCANETIHGTRYVDYPQTGTVPLVADISSCMLSGPLDIGLFGLLFGGAQKNVGPAGVAIVLVRKDLIDLEAGPALDITPSVLSYALTAKHDSLYNTPASWNIYLCGLVFKWLLSRGGLEAMDQLNQQKADLLYQRLDASGLFYGCAERSCRSLMNVTFTTGDASLDRAFIGQTQKAGMVGIKGHRSVGGMRASLYNAVSLADVQALIAVMDSFEREQRPAVAVPGGSCSTGPTQGSPSPSAPLSSSASSTPSGTARSL